MRIIGKRLEQGTVELRFWAPEKLAGYLTLLARETMLGASMNDVALRLLTDEAERKLAARYHEQVVPTASLEDAPKGGPSSANTPSTGD